MTRQLKIIIEYEEEGIDHDINGPLRKVTLYHDDEPIGCVQRLKFSADAEKPFPELEITFPDLHDPEIDNSTYPSPSSASFVKDVDEHIRDFAKIVGVKTLIKGLDKDARVYLVQELGTEGYIEAVPMKSRWKP